MHGETPQDAVRGGSPRSHGKRLIPRSPHPLNKSLEIKSYTILPDCLIIVSRKRLFGCFFFGCIAYG
ncbi:hypothetical protein DYE48_20000 [Halobacillus trueperi]|uniref:Uncharacterized protein n=1 Tax=Halobacillus trueperi TaxID=156205 RepID=A0A3E0IYF9_9BACI|nr:hypothetical protein DYE48_20000 [Halobacillus trueperi]